MKSILSSEVCGPREGSHAGAGTLFSRDLNYLRDLALFWPFVLCSIIAVGCAFSGRERQIGIRCAALAIVALLAAKERLLLFIVSLGFIAIQCAITLVLHPWSWGVFAAGVVTAGPFLVANRYWRKPKLAYRLPSEFRLVDALWSIASLCGTLVLYYFISPYN
jgi:intracellular septation protein A